MAICRSRRRGGGRPLLPSTIPFLRPNNLSFSLWYSDFKVYAFNNFLFKLGSAHSRFLKVWFSLGACLGLVALVISSMILICNSWGAFSFKGGAFWLDNFFSPGQSISFLDFALLILSTLVSIAFHEFGHAIAAASEGLQIEYIAIFLAVLFPGALVALDHNSLENLPPFSSLRVYCAGIWHNIVLCVGCALAVLSLPLLLYPFYTHGEGLVVLDVPKYSSLSAHLSPHDLIRTVDGLRVTSIDEWVKALTRDKSQNIRKKGYCTPISWVEAGNILMAGNSNGECPQEFSRFVTLHCANSSLLSSADRVENCLIAKDVVGLKKCGDASGYCACSEVYLLDGASILETGLHYFTQLTHREKQLALRVCLLVGTSLTFVACIRILFALYLL